jgi:hypothetical protein
VGHPGDGNPRAQAGVPVPLEKAGPSLALGMTNFISMVEVGRVKRDGARRRAGAVGGAYWLMTDTGLWGVRSIDGGRRGLLA